VSPMNTTQDCQSDDTQSHKPDGKNRAST